MQQSHRLCARGSALVEVMVSLVIVSLVMLGVDVAEITALREDKAGYYLRVATVQLQSMAERLAVIKDNGYKSALALWNQQNQLVLPNGVGFVRGVYPHYRLEIYWGEIGHHACKPIKIGTKGCLEFTASL